MVLRSTTGRPESLIKYTYHKSNLEVPQMVVVPLHNNCHKSRDYIMMMSHRIDAILP